MIKRETVCTLIILGEKGEDTFKMKQDNTLFKKTKNKRFGQQAAATKLGGIINKGFRL